MPAGPVAVNRNSARAPYCTLVLALALAGAALVYGDDVRRFLAIDSCLDAGGRWD